MVVVVVVVRQGGGRGGDDDDDDGKPVFCHEVHGHHTGGRQERKSL